VILIIGGNSQGKRDFVKKNLGVQDENISDGWNCPLQDAFNKPVLDHLHVLIKRAKEDGRDPLLYIQEGLDYNPKITLICDELGTGVIPIRKEERDLQESVGRILCLIAKRAEKVYRVYCSIPVLIKGDADAT
jgi:hypothetical protein